MNDAEERLKNYYEKYESNLLLEAISLMGGDKHRGKELIQEVRNIAYKRIKSEPQGLIDDLGRWLRDIMHEQKKARDLDFYINEHGDEVSKHTSILSNDLNWKAAKKQEYAEELYHQTIVGCMRDIRSYPRKVIEDIGKWLYVSIENTHKNNVRQIINRTKKVTFDSLEADPIDRPDVESEQPEEMLRNVETQSEIQALLAQLDPRDQEIMSLYFEGLDWAEIAAQLKKKLNTVISRQKRCRPKLLGLFTPKQLKYFFDKSPKSRRRMEKAIMQSPFSVLESRVMSLYVLQGLDHLEIAKELNETNETVESIVKKRKPPLFKSFYKALK